MSGKQRARRELADELPAAVELLKKETGMLGEVVQHYLQAHLDELGMSAVVNPTACEAQIHYASGQLLVHLETLVRFNVMTQDMEE